MRYAVIENGIVENIILMDDISQWDLPQLIVELNNNEILNIGWIYNENANPRFVAPIVNVIQQQWSSYQFFLRFTAEERSAFRTAALTDPNVADFQQLAQAAQEIINTDPMTMAGMDYLVSVGLLTESRKNEILGIESN